jgi:hypothetical protein
MADTENTPKPNSSAGRTFLPLAFLNAPALGQPHVTEQAARSSLMALEMFESWLTASRQMTDLWRTTVREIQDGMLATYRQQIIGAYAHDLLEEMEAPSKAPAKRSPLTKTAVAKAAGNPAA